MTTAIATVYEYARLFNLTPTNDEKTLIGNDLIFATSLVERFCLRKFAVATYNEWIKHDSVTDGQTVRLQEWPIKRIYLVGTPVSKVSLTATGVTVATATIDEDGLKLYSISGGVETDSEYDFADYTTLETLKNAIVAPWTMTIDDGYASYPVWGLKPDYVGKCTNATRLDVAVDDGGITARITDPDIEEITLSTPVDRCMIRYKAGYTVSTDNETHTAIAVQGNVPVDLRDVICSLANDVRTFLNRQAVNENSGAPQNGIISETIADYSYTLAESSSGSTYLNSLIEEKYASVLNYYAKKSLGA